MDSLRISESLSPPDLYAQLANALEAEFARQGMGTERSGDRLQVSGECDLRGLAFAVMRTLASTEA